MTITKIIATAGVTFNHPYESYANFRPSITIEADINHDEMGDQCAKRLQRLAQRLVEEEKARILTELETNREISMAKNTIANLEAIIQADREELNRRTLQPELYSAEGLRGFEENIEADEKRLAEAKARLAVLTTPEAAIPAAAVAGS